MARLHLYLVKRPESMTNYDETTGAVIIAANAPDAREFATALPGDQDKNVWYSQASVTLLGTALPNAKGGVVFSEFQPG